MASVRQMRSRSGASELERIQSIAGAPEEPRPAKFLPGLSAFALSVAAHALMIGVAIWLIGIPRIPALEKPIRVSLLAPGPPGSAAESALPHPHAPSSIPAKIHREIKTVRHVGRVEISHRRKLTPRPVISHRAEPAVATVAPTAATAHPASSTTAAGVTAGSGAGEGAAGLGLPGAGPVPVGSVAHPPRILKRVMPSYPIQARVRGITGRVEVEVVLGRDGGIRKLAVVHSIALLDQAALRAVSRWRFSPARNASGAPVSVIVDIPVVFTLDD